MLFAEPSMQEVSVAFKAGCQRSTRISTCVKQREKEHWGSRRRFGNPSVVAGCVSGWLFILVVQL